MNNTIHRIAFNDNNDEKWSMRGSFIRAFVVGVMTTGESIINIMRNGQVTDQSYSFSYIEYDPNIKSYTKRESYRLVRPNTIHRELYKTFPISIMKVCEFISPGYNIWLKDNDGNVNLFNFEHLEFIQGILTMTNAFQVNYLDVITACPIFVYYHDGIRKIKYTAIDNYPLPFFPLVNRGPFLDTIPGESYELSEIVLNEGRVIPTLESRLNLVRQFLENNIFPITNRADFINRVMFEIPGVLLYANPDEDVTITGDYLCYRAEEELGDGKEAEPIEKFLQKWGLKL